MNTVAQKPAPPPIPVQLSETEFTTFIPTTTFAIFQGLWKRRDK
jgi:hypothetical protein